MIDINSLDFKKGDGLIPAIIQDADNFQVLMLGYMNKEALQTTLEKERVTFYSRGKKRLWTKGETSGNYLNLVDIQQDCDRDTLLILANPQGPTCHTGADSCFYEKDFKPEGNDLEFLSQLEVLLMKRKSTLPRNSYTSTMFRKGLDKIAQKVGEEAVETVIASKNTDEKEMVNETADLLFHTLLLLVEKGIPLHTIVDALQERHAS